MTDRIQKEFELFAQRQGFDVQQHMGRYCRPVVRHMWATWQHQTERITDMAAALERSNSRSIELLKQLRDHDSRRVEAMRQAQALADEIDRLNTVIQQLTAEAADAEEM